MIDDNNLPKIACVGAGYWGQNLIRNFYELKALGLICDADPARLKEFSALYRGIEVADSIDAALEDARVSGVAIATPAETHDPLVRRALLAGKDVFVEKPLCLSAAAGVKLIELAAQQERILMVGHLLWYHPAILKLKRLVDDGALGRIRYIYSNRLNLGKIRREENILWSFAPHDIALILRLVGEFPTRIAATGGAYLQPHIADVTVTNMEFRRGIHAQIFVSWLHPYKEQRLVIVGSKKMAVFDDVRKENKLMIYDHQ